MIERIDCTRHLSFIILIPFITTYHAHSMVEGFQIFYRVIFHSVSDSNFNYFKEKKKEFEGFLWENGMNSACIWNFLVHMLKGRDQKRRKNERLRFIFRIHSQIPQGRRSKEILYSLHHRVRELHLYLFIVRVIISIFSSNIFDIFLECLCIIIVKFSK